MSYEKVKSIKITEGKVFLNSKANNDDEPFHKWECKSLTEYLKEHGEEETHIEILKEYENGIFQSLIDNKYTKALRTLKQFPEYAQFNWRNSTFDENCPIRQARDSKAYRELLRKAMNSKHESGQFIFSKVHYTGDTVYCYKTTAHKIKWTAKKEDAKVFKYLQELKDFINCFESADSFTIENLNPIKEPVKVINSRFKLVDYKKETQLQ